VKLRYTQQAVTDMDIAMGWYEGQMRGLGLEFLDCVEEAVIVVHGVFDNRQNPEKKP